MKIWKIVNYDVKNVEHDVLVMTNVISTIKNPLNASQCFFSKSMLSNKIRTIPAKSPRNIWQANQNIEKTNFVLFHSPRKKLSEFTNLKIGKQYIQRTKYVKFLGVLMDEHLTWKYHTTELCKNFLELLAFS